MVVFCCRLYQIRGIYQHIQGFHERMYLLDRVYDTSETGPRVSTLCVWAHPDYDAG